MTIFALNILLLEEQDEVLVAEQDIVLVVNPLILNFKSLFLFFFEKGAS